MAVSAKGRLQDWWLTTCGLSVVVAGVSALDETCRRFVLSALRGEFPTVLPGVRVHAITRQVVDFLPAGDPSLLMFGGAALVLVVVMFRS